MRGDDVVVHRGTCLGIGVACYKHIIRITTAWKRQGACTVLVTLVAESRLIIKAEMRLQHSTPEEHWPQVGDNLCDDEWRDLDWIY